MKIANLIDFLAAAHLGYAVDSPYQSRGGIMLIAPTGQLKTSILEALNEYPGVAVSSDMTVRQMGEMRTDMSSGRIKSLVVTDFQKIYERKADSASNVEGCIRGLADEGFSYFGHENANVVREEARCFVASGMPPEFYERHLPEWKVSGFARRFIWIHYKLSDPDAVMRAIATWQKKTLTYTAMRLPVGQFTIKNKLTRKRVNYLYRVASKCPGGEVQFILLQKIASVLEWRFSGTDRKAWEIIEDVTERMGEYARLEV